MITADQIRQEALAVGFDDCGVATAERLDTDAQFMEQWLSLQTYGRHDYLIRNRELRYDITRLVPGAQTVVVCLLAYAKCGKDYHRTVKSLLYQLKAHLGDRCQYAATQHIFCDSAPVLERRWAVKAHLGFIGLNHQFISPVLGSVVHLGELVLNTPVSPTSAMTTGTSAGCNDCHRCIDACPAHALGQDTWDIRRCIAYQTNYCMRCQEVCPYNTII